MVSEISQMEKGKYHMTSIICRILKKAKMNKHKEAQQKHRYKGQSRG